MKRSGILDSFRAAGWGLLETAATQKHMKVHLVSAQMVMFVAMALSLDLASRTALVFCVALIFFAEVLNTALEHFVDLHMKDFASGAMRAKDAAAAGVLVLSVATVAILGDILWMNWNLVERSGDAVQRSLMFGLPLVGVTIVQLWGPQKWWVKAAMGLAALAFAWPLWMHSTDPVFSILLGVFIAVATFSRPRPVPSA